MGLQTRNHENAAPVALVTGSGKGLGRAFACSLASQDWRLVVNNRTHVGRPSSAAKVVQELSRQGAHAVAEESDVEKQGAAEAMVQCAIDTFGRLDAVVFNAGITGHVQRLADGGGKDLREVMEINFFATHSLVVAALPLLLKAPAGRLVFIASSAGLHGLGGRAAYAASKGAMLGLARTLASELRNTSVRVNVLAPYAETDMTAGASAAADKFRPEDATAALLHLCSSECERHGEIWVTGSGMIRRAGVFEGPMGPAEPNDEAFRAVSDIGKGTEFPDATLAFADFARSAGG